MEQFFYQQIIPHSPSVSHHQNYSTPPRWPGRPFLIPKTHSPGPPPALLRYWYSLRHARGRVWRRDPDAAVICVRLLEPLWLPRGRPTHAESARACVYVCVCVYVRARARARRLERELFARVYVHTHTHTHAHAHARMHAHTHTPDRCMLNPPTRTRKWACWTALDMEIVGAQNHTSEHVDAGDPGDSHWLRPVEIGSMNSLIHDRMTPVLAHPPGPPPALLWYWYSLRDARGRVWRTGVWVLRWFWGPACACACGTPRDRPICMGGGWFYECRGVRTQVHTPGVSYNRRPTKKRKARGRPANSSLSPSTAESSDRRMLYTHKNPRKSEGRSAA